MPGLREASRHFPVCLLVFHVRGKGTYVQFGQEKACTIAILPRGAGWNVDGGERAREDFEARQVGFEEIQTRVTVERPFVWRRTAPPHGKTSTGGNTGGAHALNNRERPGRGIPAGLNQAQRDANADVVSGHGAS